MTTTLELLGWDDDWAVTYEAAATCGRAGRVSRVDRGLVTVLTAEGPVRASLGADLLGLLAADSTAGPCTGDWVVVGTWPDGPVTAEVVLPRRTEIVRAEASGTSRGQVLAANIDVVAVVASLQPEPNLGRIERLLALAWESGAEPLIVLTKADLVHDAELVAEEVRNASPGVDVLCCSTVTGAGVEVLRARLTGHRTLGLIGASGHGKSSLANALVGAAVLGTKQIRDDGRGRHTSVRRELLLLPGGGAVIDTPGLRGVGLQVEGEGIAATFPDVEALAAQCRFHDCGHDTEPGCAVQAAVAAGGLGVRRLDSWRRLQRETAWMAARSDARLRAELGRKSRHLSKQQRAEGNPKKAQQ